MANKMLIDASHPEETRVVVLRGNRVEEFDFESASKKQLRGNIYLAKVTRVEPSLQAAFVDYGGNRHGFLAFSEIHPDYYQIPVADRQALLDAETATDQEEDEEEQKRERRSRRFRRGDRNGERNGQRAEKRRAEDDVASISAPENFADVDATLQASIPHTFSLDETETSEHGVEQSSRVYESESMGGEDFQSSLSEWNPDETIAQAEDPGLLVISQETSFASEVETERLAPSNEAAFSETGDSEAAALALQSQDPVSNEWPLKTNGAPSTPSIYDIDPPLNENVLESHVEYSDELPAEPKFPPSLHDETEQPFRGDGLDGEDEGPEDEADQIEQLGGDAMEEVPVRAQHFRKQYKIQEVIKRRQILLVQVVKEERGNKGAALTTYLSLAGRYSVLMPNTARGGGISRKITDVTDRQRLKSIAQELEVPDGMGVILRTAGASRTMAEVKRDFEYLLRMWETVREMTLQSTAPMLVYEEGSLIKRSIRDLFNKDIDEILVSGENAFREARDFMRMLMPSHVKNVIPYLDPQPIFAKSGAEAQLDAMYGNQVTMKSGGSIVINQTEALVAIDVNSGRSTREHNIEDTALRTNLEACDEIARQLRLRDLAGLIVVDFIDMEESRNNRAVERRMKDALKNDRARIQVGHISHFGLLEMSRQRIRTGVLEGSTLICPHCAGAGMVRSTASVALHVLRVLEDMMIKNPGYEFTVKTRTPVALYILNQKRANLRDLEERFGVPVIIATDDTLTGTSYHALERGELVADPREILSRVEPPRMPVPELPEAFLVEELEEEGEADTDLQDDTMPDEAEASDADAKGEGENGNKRRRRRRRRGGRGGDREGLGIAPNAPQPSDEGLGIFAPNLSASIPERTEPYFASTEPVQRTSPEFTAQIDELSGEAAPQGHPPYHGVDEMVHPAAESFSAEASLEAASAEEKSDKAEMNNGFVTPAADEVPQDEVCLKDEEILVEVPQRKRGRRSPRNVAAEAPEEAVKPLVTEGGGSGAEAKSPDGEEGPQRRRPRRPARARSPRRGGDPETSSNIAQVELGLMETFPSQPQPVNILLDRDDAAQQMLSETRPETPPLSSRTEGSHLANHEIAKDEITASQDVATSPSPVPDQDQPAAVNETRPPEPPQPKRSGWWQRAKASLRG